MSKQAAADGPMGRYLEALAAVAVPPAAAAGPFSGTDACRRLADTLDRSLAEIFTEDPPAGVAVVAVGGYGRREQCRHSDLDVMLIVANERAGRAAKRLLYPLWDSGLKVGHSVRTVDQAIEACDRLETLTALLDSRLVDGDEGLYRSFHERFTRSLSARLATIFEGLAEQRRLVLAREPWQLQEPDLKTGRGGLRALQAVHWINTALALAAGTPAPTLPPDTLEARETLLASRHAIHAHTERPSDRYVRDVAPRVAAWLGEDPAEWSRRLFGAMRLVDRAAAGALSGRPAQPQGRGVFRALTAWHRGKSAVLRSPAVALPEDDSWLGEASDTPSDLEHLLAALESAGPASLEPLPPREWLDRLLPEWDGLRCLPHAVLFHSHPVDVHAWRSVEEAAHALREDADGAGTVEAGGHIRHRSELLLAALLHDIGKGHHVDHSEAGAVIAERFAARAGLDPEAGWRLSEAVRLHLLIPTVATRRDIADVKVINEVATAVRDPRMLHLLYVLSVADSRASGPDVWSPWRAQLMRTLYLRVLRTLETEHAVEDTVASLRSRAEAALEDRFPASEIARHLDGLPVNYLLSTPPDTIGKHIALIREAGDGTVAGHDLAGRIDRLTVVARDRPGILSLVAGTLAVHNVNVLGGSAFTRDDGIAIDVFHVGDALGHGIDEQRWARVLAALPDAVAGKFPVQQRLAETRAAYKSAVRAKIETTVHVDNSASDRYSIVEVNTADRLGLLYAITQALGSRSLDIHLAKVDTIGPEVADAFYVQKEDGGRLNHPDDIEDVRLAILAAIQTLDG